jgi:hypothetical protein
MIMYQPPIAAKSAGAQAQARPMFSFLAAANRRLTRQLGLSL